MKAKSPRKTKAAADLLGFALSALAATGPETRGDSPEAAFLETHSGHPLRGLPAYLKNPAPSDVAPVGLAGEMGLKPIEVLSVALCSAVETNVVAGRAVAWLQAPLAGSRPTLGLLATAFAPLAGSVPAAGALLTGAAIGSGLLALLNEAAPASERAVAVPLPLSLALGGQEVAWPRARPPDWDPCPRRRWRHPSWRRRGGMPRHSKPAARSPSWCGRVRFPKAGRWRAPWRENLGRRPLFLEPNAATAGLTP
jgi:hypothetical protein